MGKDGACGGVAATKAHMEKRNECLNWSGLAEGTAGYPFLRVCS